MLIRAQNIAQGYSGIHPDLLRAYLRLLEIGITPCVPAIGSVGASGDLIPLSFIARALSGSSGSPDARVVYQNREMPAAEALALAGLMPMALEGRDALSLTNGTSFLTAYATIAVARAERLLAWGEKLTGWLYRLLGARTAALDPRLHEVRGHIGQYESAENIRQEVERFGTSEDTTRQLQEVYSLRCAPQILGACRDSLTFARQLVETEINGCSDNPVFIAEGEAVLHGGNFQGQQVAFAADALNAALTQAGVLAERQVDLLVTPSESNGNAPLLLSWEPGPASGFAGAQITATALVAEMRSNTQAHATMSIPTNGRNQDVVSMGTLAARKCYEQTERLAGILAILSLTAGQFRFLSQRGKAVGRDTPPPSGLPPFEGLTQDRPLHNDIRTTASAILTPLHSKE
jgi:histidine ammonia-lyase/tyrosine ammonia-lyase